MKKAFLFLSLAAAGLASADTVKFAKTSVTVKESATYAELTVDKTGTAATRVRFATVSGTAVPGSEYYATNGVLAWAEGKAKSQKIRVRLMPDEVPTYEPDKTFGVQLVALDADELAADETVADVTTPEARVTVTEVTKKPSSEVSAAGYYDEDEEWCPFADAKKPALTLSKNGDGGLVALALARTGYADEAVRVTVRAVNGTAKLGTDFTLGDDPDVRMAETSVEWKAGETGEKFVWICAIDDEDGSDGTYAKAFSLKLASVKNGDYAKATLSASSVSVTLRDAGVSETIADFNARMKSEGVSVSATGWYLSSGSTALVSEPLAGGRKASFTVSCTGPGFFTTTGSKEYNGEFTWTCGKLSGWADADVEFVVPSGKSTIRFAYEADGELGDDEFDFASISTWDEEDRPFTWVSFADVRPSPGDKAVVLAPTARNLAWSVPERAAAFEDDVRLHYRVRLAASAADLDKKPLFVTNVATSAVQLPEGVVDRPGTYCWRVDYLYGDDGSDEQIVAKGKASWQFTVAEEGTPSVRILTGTDACGAPVTGDVVRLRQGLKVNWTLGSDAEEAVKLACAAGKLPDGLKLAKDSKSGAWMLSGTPTKAGDYQVVLGGTAGKTRLLTRELDFEVAEIGLAAGTFAALLADEGNQAEMTSRRVARIDFTASAAGKLSAKVQLGGKTYAFSDTGYAACEAIDDAEDEDVTAEEADYRLTARMTNVQRIGGVSYTNELEIAVRDARTDNLDALGSVIGTVTLKACVPTADGKSADVDADGCGLPFSGSLYRDNSKETSVASALKAFAGYYTLALLPSVADSPDAPSGNGYLTVTVDDRGSAKFAGKLADGTAFSQTAWGGFVGLLADWAGSRQQRLLFPLFNANATRVFGGELAFALEADGETSSPALVDSDSSLVWNDDAATATYDTASGEWSGFALTLEPAGGWFDTVCNLQAHYRRVALSVGEEGGPEAYAVALENDKPLVSSESGTTLKLSRATGVVTGTVLEWDDYAKASVKASHAGVLLMNYQTDTVEGLWSVGFGTFPRKVGSKKVTMSRPFCVYAEDIDPDFAAGDAGDWTGEPVEREE